MLGAKPRTAEINLHGVARDSAASEPIRAGTVIKLRFSVTGAPAVTKLQVMPRVTQWCELLSARTRRNGARSELSNSLKLLLIMYILFYIFRDSRGIDGTYRRNTNLRILKREKLLLESASRVRRDPFDHCGIDGFKI